MPTLEEVNKNIKFKFNNENFSNMAARRFIIYLVEKSLKFHISRTIFQHSHMRVKNLPFQLFFLASPPLWNF